MDAMREVQGKETCEKEIHTFLDSLTKENFYGEVTFYFQNGTVEFCRKISRLSKNEIIAIQQKLKNFHTKDEPQAASQKEV